VHLELVELLHSLRLLGLVCVFIAFVEVVASDKFVSAILLIVGSDFALLVVIVDVDLVELDVELRLLDLV